MSVRVMEDGRPYPKGEGKPRPYHKPQPSQEPLYWKCAVCGQPWSWVDDARTDARFRRHYPGTFWERD